MAKIGRVLLAITQWAIGGIIVLAGFFGIMWFIGSAIETVFSK